MYIFYHHAAHISIRRTNIGADVSRRRFGAYNICKAESFPPQGPMRRPRRGVSGAVTYAAGSNAAFLLPIISPRGGAVTYAAGSRMPDKINTDGAGGRSDTRPHASAARADGLTRAIPPPTAKCSARRISAVARTFAQLQCRTATPQHNIAAAAYARAIYREIYLSSIFCRKMNFYVLHIFGVNGLWKSQSFQRRENRGKPMNMRFPKSFQKPFENSVFAFIK